MPIESHPHAPSLRRPAALGDIVGALLADAPDERLNTWSISPGRDALPAVLRRRGQLCVLDVTKWFGETSSGVKTYLIQKSRYLAQRPDLRHVLVIPSKRDLVTTQGNVRWYRLRGPRVPQQSQYRFLPAWASLQHRGHWLVRIALHPSDLSHPATAASVEASLDYWLERRRPWTYAGL